MPQWARQLEARLLAGRPLPADKFWVDPARVLSDAGLPPDPWQLRLLRRPAPQTLLNCSRQCGKSTAAAGLALVELLTVPGSLVLLLSPSLRQSSELFRKLLNLYAALGRPVPLLRPRDNALKLELANGSRCLSLPGDEQTVRGFSAPRLLVIDEASRVPDELLHAVRPMLAVSGGRLVCLSTPFGRRGWFYDEWTGQGDWCRVRVPAEECPRISAEFLARERALIGERWYRQEYGCEFLELLGAAFSGADIDALPDPTAAVRPFPGVSEC
jgi:hypothetical protein